MGVAVLPATATIYLHFAGLQVLMSSILLCECQISTTATCALSKICYITFSLWRYMQFNRFLQLDFFYYYYNYLVE